MARPLREGDRVTAPEHITCELRDGTVRIPAGTVLTVLQARLGHVMVMGGSEPVWIPAVMVRADTWGGGKS